MERCADYPGSFDPPTLGHLNLVERGLDIFDRIIVVVAVNSAKSTLFSPEERVEMLKLSLADFDSGRVEVVTFNGLLVNYVRERKAVAILRGLRTAADFEYESQMAMINNQLEPGVQSVFLMTDYRWLALSSTIVKEIASYGVDVSSMVPPMVPPLVAARLKDKFSNS